MAKRFQFPDPPRGVSRLFYRFPILMYRIGLGGFFGERFLLLEHIGRKSGLVRYAVIEIIRHDREEEAYLVVSGFGEKSDWYRNTSINPNVYIIVLRKRLPAKALELSRDRAKMEVLDYAERNPTVFRTLARSLLGYPVETEEEVQELASQLIVVGFFVKGND
ncbi:MAG: nitroreductase family deazaflavin-dependent oxidoreductase [Anaerolineales bacterium]|nr:nitroreductase family deazaflavin-dependent oxidoreductase [Anaerolineales bacterium]